MLKAIEILLGITMVMLIASMAVTVLTQFITAALNSRGQHLLRGLGDLLQQIDPKLEREIAEQISRAVLTHPMISHLQTRYGAALGSTIHREEFTKLLMDLAAGQGFGVDERRFSQAAQQTLERLLRDNGIADPAATVEKVGARALQLELTSPELATNVRHSIALIQEANSRLLAKINSWFDQTIVRVSERFTASPRIITLCCSVIGVAALQLDTLDVINRLSMDAELRQALVTKALELDQGQIENNRTAGDSAESVGNTRPASANRSTTTQTVAVPGSADIQALKAEVSALQDLGLINVWGWGKGWCERWRQVNPLGIVPSIFLLSLGAPFWYEALKKLLKLRGVVAGKDDEQRRERQSTQAPPPPPAGAPPVIGSRGALS